MIYALVGTDIVKREKAKKGYEHFGSVSAHVYGEHVHTLESFIDAGDLFGEKVIVHLVQLMDTSSSKKVVTQLFPRLQASQNIFIMDEPFADTYTVKAIQKYAKEFVDARLPKGKEVDVFTLSNLFARRDKKGLWTEWMRVRDLDSGEAFQGILWWKFVTMWTDVKKGRASKYSEAECEEIGGKLVRASILAHQGKADLKVELEKIIVGV